MKPIDRVKIEDARVRYLNCLYEMDGRSDPEHPLHARYTGLVLKYGQQCV